VRAFYSGLTYVYTGSGERVTYNFYVVHLINATFGRLGCSGVIPLVFRNLNATVYQYSARMTLTLSEGQNCGATTLSPGVSIEIKLHSTGGKEYPKLATLP